MKITEFLLARITEDEVRATPKTICVSGGPPAPEVPNCIGPDGRGCSDHWRLEPPVDASQRWWNTPGIEAQMRAHEMTHITPSQHRGLAECTAKRAIVDLYELHRENRDARRSWIARGGEEDGQAVRDRRTQEARTRVAEDALYALASVYADHPDYEQEWAL
jgi:hypothetical protein